MGKNITNRASGNDRTAVQAGSVTGDKSSKPAKTDTTVSVSNTRSGNARVGHQADEIRGGISF